MNYSAMEEVANVIWKFAYNEYSSDQAIKVLDALFDEMAIRKADNRTFETIKRAIGLIRCATEKE